jgi:hypothetical protein
VRLTAVGLACCALAVAGCGREFRPPERTDAVREEENRLVEVLERSGAVVPGAATCTVRLLGWGHGISYAWADCRQKAGPTAASVPVRVEGLDVQMPQDGGGYASSLRRMFPSRIAEAILDNPDGFRP